MAKKKGLSVDCAEIRNYNGDDRVLIGIESGTDGVALGVKAVMLSPDGAMAWYDSFQSAAERCQPEGDLPAALRVPVLAAYVEFLDAELKRASVLWAKAHPRPNPRQARERTKRRLR